MKDVGGEFEKKALSCNIRGHLWQRKDKNRPRDFNIIINNNAWDKRTYPDKVRTVLEVLRMMGCTNTTVEIRGVHGDNGIRMNSILQDERKGLLWSYDLYCFALQRVIEETGADNIYVYCDDFEPESLVYKLDPMLNIIDQYECGYGGG